MTCIAAFVLEGRTLDVVGRRILPVRLLVEVGQQVVARFDEGVRGGRHMPQRHVLVRPFRGRVGVQPDPEEDPGLRVAGKGLPVISDGDVTLEAVLVRLAVADLARQRIAVDVVHLDLGIAGKHITVTITAGGQGGLVPHRVVRRSGSVEVADSVTIDARHAHLVVDVPGETDRSHELASVPHAVTGEAGLIHRRGAEELVLVDQAAGIAVRPRDVTLAAGGVTVHAVELVDFTQAFMEIVKGVGIAGELDQGVAEPANRGVQGCRKGVRHFLVALGADAVDIGRRSGVDPVVGMDEAAFIAIAAVASYTAQLSVGG